MAGVSVLMNGRVAMADYVPPRGIFCAPQQEDPIEVVDAAVRAVLAEFRRSHLVRQRTSNFADIFECVDVLFSARHAEKLPPGIRAVEVAPRTVVTPLARDLLKRKGIAIRLGSGKGLRAARGDWAFAIDCEEGSLMALRRTLLEDVPPWSELDPAIERVAAWILEAEGRGALLVAAEPAVAVWRACQVAGIRAAAACEPAEVHRAVRSLGVNLLVVEPAGKSISWIKQMGTALRHAGAPRAPDSTRGEDLR